MKCKKTYKKKTERRENKIGEIKKRKKKIIKPGNDAQTQWENKREAKRVSAKKKC